MNIPDAAVRSGTIALHSLVPIHSDEAEGRIVEAVLEAALPYLIASYRERLTGEIRHLEDAYDNHPSRDGMDLDRMDLIRARTSGVETALSYLDEATR